MKKYIRDVKKWLLRVGAWAIRTVKICIVYKVLYGNILSSSYKYTYIFVYINKYVYYPHLMVVIIRLYISLKIY